MNSLLDNILPAHDLGIKITGWHNGKVELTAPLAKNLNDKGTAFAGSIDSMLDLAGWSAITLALREAGIAADVMIVKCKTEYTAAVRSNMTATAELSENEKSQMLQKLSETGRYRIALQCRLFDEDRICTSMNASYAVIAEKSR